TDPDLIVLDLMLPGRSGLDLLGEIRGVGGHERTPIVVISAWAHSDEAAVAAGADRFVAKPCDRDELNTTVADLLETDGDRSGSGRASRKHGRRIALGAGDRGQRRARRRRRRAVRRPGLA